MTPLFCSSCKILSDLVGEGFSNLDLNLRDERKEQRVCCGGGVIGHPLIIIINLLTKDRWIVKGGDHAFQIMQDMSCQLGAA